MAGDQELIARLRLVLDEAEAKKTEEGVKRTKKAIETTQKDTKGTADSAKALDQAFGSIARRAAGILTVGTALRAVGKAVEDYVSKASFTEDVSNRWLAATENIDIANQRLGKYVASQLIPYYEYLAQLAEHITRPNPQEGFFQQGANASADFLNQFFTKLLGKDLAGRLGFRDTTAPGYSGESVENQNKATLPQLKLMYQYRRQEEEAERSFQRQQFVMRRSFELQETYAEQDYSRSRNIALRDFNLQQGYAEQDLYRQRSIALRNFEIQQLYAEQDFNRQRALQLRDFHISVQRQEEDHQRQLRRNQEDWQFEQFDLIRAGDAMSYIRARRSHDIQLRRSEEDYDIGRARQMEDFKRQQGDQEAEYKIQRERQQAQFALQQADQATEYQIQRSRQAEQFELQRADQAQDYQIQRQRAMAAYQLQLGDLQYSFDEQARLRRQALYDQLSSMMTDERQIAGLRQQFSDQAISDFAYTAQTMTGYIDTIKEAASKLPSAVPYGTMGTAAGAQGTTSIAFHQQNAFNGSTGSDLTWLFQAIQNSVYQAFAEIYK